MNDSAKRLCELTHLVAESDRPVSSFGMEMVELSILLRKPLESCPSYADAKRVNSPTTTEVGVALDPWHASLSLDDRGRTAGFMRGCVRAVENILAKRPGRPVHFVEAGCGPLATLSVPLMSRFSPDQLQVTLIDYHEKSIFSAEHLINELGFADRLRNSICGDLMNLELKEEVDVIGLETMAAALFREPQVALSMKLVETFPDALLIPEKISIDLQVLDIPLETCSVPPRPRNRIMLGRVLDLDAETCSTLEIQDGCLPSVVIPAPTSIEKNQGLYLTTTVNIFEDVFISDYDADITVPAPLGETSDSWLNRAIQLRYRVSGSPGFEWGVAP